MSYLQSYLKPLAGKEPRSDDPEYVRYCLLDMNQSGMPVRCECGEGELVAGLGGYTHSCNRCGAVANGYAFHRLWYEQNGKPEIAAATRRQAAEHGSSADLKVATYNPRELTTPSPKLI